MLIKSVVLKTSAYGWMMEHSNITSRERKTRPMYVRNFTYVNFY